MINLVLGLYKRFTYVDQYSEYKLLTGVSPYAAVSLLNNKDFCDILINYNGNVTNELINKLKEIILSKSNDIKFLGDSIFNEVISKKYFNKNL